MFWKIFVFSHSHHVEAAGYLVRPAVQVVFSMVDNSRGSGGSRGRVQADNLFQGDGEKVKGKPLAEVFFSGERNIA